MLNSPKAVVDFFMIFRADCYLKWLARKHPFFRKKEGFFACFLKNFNLLSKMSDDWAVGLASHTQFNNKTHSTFISYFTVQIIYIYI